MTLTDIATFGPIGEDSSTDGDVTLQHIGETLLHDQQGRERVWSEVMDVLPGAFTRSKRTFSKSDGAPRWMVRVTSVVPLLWRWGEGQSVSVQLKDLSSVSHFTGDLQVLRSRVDEVELRQAQRSVGLRQRPAANTTAEEEEEE